MSRLTRQSASGCARTQTSLVTGFLRLLPLTIISPTTIPALRVPATPATLSVSYFMASTRAEVKAVTTAVLNYIQSAQYTPPSLPIVAPEYWSSILDQSSGNTLLFTERLAVGTDVLNFALCMLLSETSTFQGRPPAFTEIIRKAVSSRAVLREILSKTDPELSQINPEHLENGFRYLIGYYMLQVAADAYDACPHTNTKLEKQEYARKQGAVAFLETIPFLDLETITCLDPAVLMRRQPPSPSTPRRAFLTLPQPYGRDPYAIRTSSPSDGPEGELALRAPSTPEGRVWTSLASPSGLEAELKFPDLSLERPASEDPPSRLISLEELRQFLDANIELNELADKSSEFSSSSPSTRLGTSEGPSRRLQFKLVVLPLSGERVQVSVSRPLRWPSLARLPTRVAP
ncbi:hypothetical protein MSAN_00673100 [Mycena sanguinolenta]|uniref:Uncharacterized protein n=1 Tax=Mycena sanguinolenta TaxID=230812 RepID=A0A8H6Z4I7_9AGAR|nr:hypothetical protein MSAN_00673100 [Mycena sanguinolenta]